MFQLVELVPDAGQTFFNGGRFHVEKVAESETLTRMNIGYMGPAIGGVKM